MNRPYAEVIGDPIAQSKSPLIHNFWLSKLGIDAEYQACHVQAAGLADYLHARRADSQWRGCNVTMPHKQAVMPSLDQLDPLAARVGAVNTVVRDGDGGLRGFNTDVPGFLEPLQAVLGQRHHWRMARVLGTGGAARAVVAGLLDHGVLIVLAGRDHHKARSMLDDFAPGGDHHVTEISHFAAPTVFAFDDREGCLDLVINASLLGMTGQPPLRFDLSHAPPGSICYDIVTSPADTAFLQAARAAGFATIDGLAMLIGQAAVAFEKFFGEPAPRKYDADLRALLNR